MPEQLLDAISELNENGVPHLGTCTVIIGDGTMKVDFNNGRAKVPASWARLLARDSRITVYGLDSAPAVDQLAPPAADTPPEVELPEDAVELAREHLAEEGLETPEVEVADSDQKPDGSVPGRFEATTADGQPRCQAAKADGSQCANPAKSGDACQLPKHQQQLTQ